MKPVLIAEDQTLLAMLLKEQLESIGFEVAGPARSVAEALVILDGQPLCGAVVDVGLEGGDVYPLLDQLVARGIPILISTGRSRQDLPEKYRSMPLLGKPYVLSDVESMAQELFANPGE